MGPACPEQAQPVLLRPGQGILVRQHHARVEVLDPDPADKTAKPPGPPVRPVLHFIYIDRGYLAPAQDAGPEPLVKELCRPGVAVIAVRITLRLLAEFQTYDVIRALPVQFLTGRRRYYVIGGTDKIIDAARFCLVIHNSPEGEYYCH